MKDKTLSSNYSFKGTIWLFMLVLSSFMYVANAQQRNVQGMVTDPNGEPIIGASVVEESTTNGTITDIDGNFSLKVSPKSRTERLQILMESSPSLMFPKKGLSL